MVPVVGRGAPAAAFSQCWRLQQRRVDWARSVVFFAGGRRFGGQLAWEGSGSACALPGDGAFPAAAERGGGEAGDAEEGGACEGGKGGRGADATSTTRQRRHQHQQQQQQGAVARLDRTIRDGPFWMWIAFCTHPSSA